MEAILCIKCKQPMPEIRFTKYGYKACVNCSTISTYKGVVTTNGEGDHTWNDLEIISDNQYSKLKELEKKHDPLFSKEVMDFLKNADLVEDDNYIEEKIINEE
jgi:RNA polymerase subunit RPABC4/transcription elongation factor Spt4